MQVQEINLMVLNEQHKDLIRELQFKKEYCAMTRQKPTPLSYTMVHAVGTYMVNLGSKLQHYGVSQRTIATAKR